MTSVESLVECEHCGFADYCQVWEDGEIREGPFDNGGVCPNCGEYYLDLEG